MKALKDKKGSDNGKVINLVKSLAKSATDRGAKEPYLISIAERAEAVMSELEDRQVSTKVALEKIEALMQEKLAAEKARKESGLDPETFEIFWFLQQEKLSDALMLAKEISAVYKRFPNSDSNTDEHRQLKAEIYKSLLRVVSGKRMVGMSGAEPTLRRRWGKRGIDVAQGEVKPQRIHSETIHLRSCEMGGGKVTGKRGRLPPCCPLRSVTFCHRRFAVTRERSARRVLPVRKGQMLSFYP